jgi:cytochrome b561
LLAVGYVMVDLPKQTPTRGLLFGLHKSFGILAAMLIVVRIGWRTIHSPPPISAGTSKLRVAAIRVTHGLLYAGLVLQPSTGYLAAALGTYGVRFFGLPLGSLGANHPELRAVLVTTHHFVASVMIALIAVHLLGVVMQVRRAGWHSLRRMT